jgi:hypothetical protein
MSQDQITLPAAAYSTGERSDTYPDVILRVGRHRIIRCRNDIQWITQRRPAGMAATPRWDSLTYHRCRDALIRAWRGLEPQHGQMSWPDLDVLPSHYREGSE